MALINCEECGKEISNKASACIHCGCPLALFEKKYENDNVKSSKKVSLIKETYTTKTVNNKVSLIKEIPTTKNLDFGKKVIKGQNIPSYGNCFELIDYSECKIVVVEMFKDILKLELNEALNKFKYPPIYICDVINDKLVMDINIKLHYLPIEYNFYKDGVLKKCKVKDKV